MLFFKYVRIMYIVLQASVIIDISNIQCIYIFANNIYVIIHIRIYTTNLHVNNTCFGKSCELFFFIIVMKVLLLNMDMECALSCKYSETMCYFI